MMNQDLIKLDQFDGSNFGRWQDNVKFLLTALRIVYILNCKPLSEPGDNASENEKKEWQWRNDDEVMCRGHILNALSDRLYNFYKSFDSAKEIWKALEYKYKNREEEEETEKRKGTGDREEIRRGKLERNSQGSREIVLNQTPNILNVDSDPMTYTEAVTSRDVAFWKEAINDEIDSIMSNETWTLVVLPPGSKPIGCKWVFRMKYNSDGSVQTLKTRLVAKGFKQKE
ncbi:hypothetical protein RJ639_000929 [Escallonia herrerae]|uniref:Reverse transcriptase Ty1/copia-type domain-containing protein n=1 Tax=Escallonia herrerae TaxID=1293975 RepID=A0AA89BN16_9ASTE|nr:hypothetical protein RJ639_000929 [Escallonia herrerae]